MSEMWNRTLVYLGLREEPEEMYDELPASFDPEDDPHAEHAQPRPGSTRRLVGAAAGPRGETSGVEDPGSPGRDDPVARPRGSGGRGSGGRGSGGRGSEGRGSGREERGGPADSNVRPLRTGDPAVRPASAGGTRSGRVALVDVASFDDVEAIGSRYRTGQPVLFDVVADRRAEAQRVVDFVSGLTYVSRGRLTKVGARAFLLVPDGVVVDEEEQGRLRGLGYRVPHAHDA